MNYREIMRKAVECPQFGNIDYGEWGSLNLNQRRDIKRLLDEMDRADEYIKNLYFKNENLQSKIDKANNYIDSERKKIQQHQYSTGIRRLNKIQEILKEAK